MHQCGSEKGKSLGPGKKPTPVTRSRCVSPRVSGPQCCCARRRKRSVAWGPHSGARATEIWKGLGKREAGQSTKESPVVHRYLRSCEFPAARRVGFSSMTEDLTLTGGKLLSMGSGEPLSQHPIPAAPALAKPRSRPSRRWESLQRSPTQTPRCLAPLTVPRAASPTARPRTIPQCTSGGTLESPFSPSSEGAPCPGTLEATGLRMPQFPFRSQGHIHILGAFWSLPVTSRCRTCHVPPFSFPVSYLPFWVGIFKSPPSQSCRYRDDAGNL
ncbi:hypothetical protein VUR80DRAFT_1355 [Thermomyces stellatus]